MTTSFVASCSCGAFKLKATRTPILQITCHCQQCREASKTPFTNFAFFKLADTEISGATKAMEFVADSGSKTVREFCASCGELLLDRTEGFPQIVGVVAERIQPPYEFQPRCHVWLESKVVDVVLPDTIKTFARGMQ
jgi:hypothetical protein